MNFERVMEVLGAFERAGRDEHKFRSIEAAQVQRDAWEQADFERFWTRQRALGARPG